MAEDRSFDHYRYLDDYGKPWAMKMAVDSIELQGTGGGFTDIPEGEEPPEFPKSADNWEPRWRSLRPHNPTVYNANKHRRMYCGNVEAGYWQQETGATIVIDGISYTVGQRHDEKIPRGVTVVKGNASS